MKLIENLKWRYATKKFDASKKVSDQDIESLKDAIQLSASSYGLQLYKILIVEDQSIKEKLKSVSYNQSQLTDASHVFVFCHFNDVQKEDVDYFLKVIAEQQHKKLEDLEGFGKSIMSAMDNLSEEQKKNWTAKQTYIALGNLLAAAPELKIDACPMEGFDAQKYDEILGLSEKGLSAAVIATVGYRSEEDQTQHAPKARKPKEVLFEHL